ncbi:MAG: hypothetical protein Metus_1445 [Candidatus Methanosuratincola subterraneus]|uniref:Uncharacterized protein n=1 Tax=Methanosuratincola subterraneus TaxID=2593994 RepID=A0A3S3S025_METS7|nr:MAG: hypothetical protein Metus_1445 [Candidatus Methanosuratincola subterraneus]
MAPRKSLANGELPYSGGSSWKSAMPLPFGITGSRFLGVPP